MLEYVYAWIESRTGVSYDFNQELASLAKGTLITSPMEFLSGYRQIINELTDCVDALNEYKDEIPEDLPDYKQLQELFAATVLDGVKSIIDSYMDKLSMRHVEINSMNELNETVEMLCALTNIFRYESPDEIIQNKTFEKLDDEYDNMFTDELNIVPSDMLNLATAIDALKEVYDDTDDE